MNKVYIVMYHYVRDLLHSKYPDIKGLDYCFFKDQIKFFKDNFNVVTMEAVLEAYITKTSLPDKALLLTFDDGYIDHYTNVFPILAAEKMQGSFFIPGKTFTEHKVLDVNKIHFVLASADINVLLKEVFRQLDYYRGNEYDLSSNTELFETYAVENRFDKKETVLVKRLLQTVLPENLRNQITSSIFEKYVGLSEEKFAYELYMSYEQIRCMKKAGMHIGLHGYDHYWLGNLDKPKLEDDIAKALDVMSDFIDINSWVMNYPYGSYRNDVINYIDCKGCKLGLTTEGRVADLSEDGQFTIPRLDTQDFPPKSNRYLKFGGFL